MHLSISSLSVLPSPVNRRVGIHDFTFGACSSFTRVAACQIACPPIADVCPEAPTQPVTRPSRSVATMLIDVYMDGSSSHWRSAPLRRAVNYRVGTFIRVPSVNRPIFEVHATRSELRVERSVIACTCSECVSVRCGASEGLSFQLLLDLFWGLNLMLALRTDSIHNRTDSLCRLLPVTHGDT